MRGMAPALRSASPLAALRCRQWLHFALLPLAGQLATDARLVGGVAVAGLCLAYAYGLNGISDRATDLDPSKNPLAGVDRYDPSVRLVLAACAAAALGGAAVLGWRPLLAASASLGAGTVYSVGPRIKRFPVVCTLSNVVIFAPLLWLARATSGAPAGFALLVASFVVQLVQNQLLHECADAPEDARAGVLTTARLLGEPTTRRLVVLLGAAGALATARLSPSTLGAAVAILGLTLTTAIALPDGLTPTDRRTTHRRLALAAGAALFASLR
jgi:4-hydroxybenzoate polyprenyltransferase